MSYEEQYKKWKRQQEEQKKSGNQQGYSSYEDSYKAYQWQQNGQKIVDELNSRVSTWLKNNENYVYNYNERFKGNNTTYRNDAGDWLATITTQKNNFDKEADSIMSLVNQYKDYFGEEYVTQVTNALNGNRKVQADILANSTRDNQYWSKFESETMYNDWMAEQKRKADLYSFDTEAGQFEIEELQELYDYQKVVDQKYRDMYYDSSIDEAELESRYSALQAEYEERLKLYGGRDGLANLIDSKKRYLEDARYEQGSDALYEELSHNADFSQKSQKEWDGEAANIYDIGGIQWGIKASADPGWMNDKEKAIFYYKWHTEGKDAANEYRKSINEILERRGKEVGLENAAKFADESPVLASVFSVFATPMTAAETVVNAMDYAATGDFDRNHSADVSSTIRGTVSDNIYWSSKGEPSYDAKKAAKEFDLGVFLYNTGMSGADSIASGLMFGKAGGVVLGLSAAGQAANDAIDRGLSNEKAFWNGLAAGAFEMFWESISIGKFLDGLKDGIGTGFKSTLKSLASSMLTNAGEEVATEVSNIAYDAIANGDLSAWALAIKTNMANGMTEQEAKHKAALDFAWQVTEAGLSGALIGGGMTAAQSARSAYNRYADTRAIGKAIKKTNPNAVSRLKTVGSTFSADTVAYKVANKITDKTGAYTIGKLFNAVNAELTEQNLSDIVSTLAAKNIPADEAQTIAKWMNDVVDGNALTDEQKTLLEENEVIGNVFREVIIDKNSTVNQRTQGIAHLFDIEQNAKASASTETTATAPVTAEDAVASVAEDNSTPTANIAENGQYEVNAEARTIRKDTGADADIAEIASINNGKMTLRLTDGTEVDSDSLSYGRESDAVIYEAIAKMDVNAAAANALFNAYDGKSDAFAYAKGIQEAYRYGQYNFPIAEMASAPFASGLADFQRNTAYKLGQRFAGEQVARAQAAVRKKGATGKKTGRVHFDGNRESLTEKQRTNLSAMEKVAEALGVQIHVFESKVDKNGKRYYTNDNGDVITANGWYDRGTGTIHIDLHAGFDGSGVMMFTLAHELTHFIKQWSPAKFKVLANFLVQEYGKKGISVDELVRKQIEKAQEEGRTISYDIAFEEVVADSMESMLADGNIVDKLAKLKQQDKSLWQKIKDFIADLAKKIRAVYEGINPDSLEGNYVAQMKDSIERIQELFTEGLVDASENFQSALVTVDTDTQSASPLFSERTWTASEYVQQRENAAKAISKALNVTLKEAYRYIDDINSIARLIADDRVRLDYESNMDDGATVLKANSEYKYTVDMSTLCAKRLLFTGTFDAIQKALPNTVFDSDDIVRLREMMQKRGLEVACGICYVESTRREIGRITQEFIDRYKAAQKAGKPITRINSKGEEVTLSVKGKVFHTEDGYTPNLGELNTTDIDVVKRDHREVYEAYLAFMNARGQAKPKLLETRAEYKGEILTHFKAKSAVNSRNAHGGLRLQSFSDFEVPHMIDMMQVIMDMSRVGLKSQAYTKVPAFADVFGGTGVKINLSLIAKGSGLDANGNLIFDDVEGINHEEAFRLREKYSNNVGTILVGKSKAHIIAAMADPRIDFIIPFHKSSWKESLYEALGLTGYEDFTESQNEKPIDPNRKISNFDPSEYWDFSKTGDENAEIYLQRCREDGRTPKFPEFIGYPGYWKLLIDFKMYNNEGIGVPQEVVHPDFDMDAANRILSEYKGGHRSFPVAKDVVSDFVAEYNSNTRYSTRKNTSLPDRDSNGAELSEAQQEFFKNSKVRDADGNLLPVYHGTPTGGFTTFEMPHYLSSLMSAQGAGFYFTDEQNAKQYMKPRNGKVDKNRQLYKVYLNITNPMEITPYSSGHITDQQMRDIFARGNYEWGVAHTDVEKMIQVNKLDSDRLASLVRVFNGDAILDAMRDVLGYDGVRFTDEYGDIWVAWEQSQIKDINNTNPTHSKDIRYSTRKSTSLPKYNANSEPLTEAQRRHFNNSKAVNEHGRLIPLYHGTENGGFTVFDPQYSDDGISLFLTDNVDLATTYSGTSNRIDLKKGKPKMLRWTDATDPTESQGQHGVYKVYANITNPIVIDAEGGMWHTLNYNGETMSTREIAHLAKTEGYDGVIIRNVYDGGKYRKGTAEEMGTVYIVFDSNQIKDVNNTNPTAHKDIRYSTRKSFSSQVDNVLSGTFPRGNAVWVGDTPKILQDIGLNGNLPMLTTAKHIRLATMPKNRKKHQHGLTSSQIKRLPYKIAHPVMVMDSLDGTSNSIVVVTDMLDPDGMPVIVAIKADGSGMYNNVEIDSNFVLSYYGREKFADFIDDNVNKDTFLFIDKEKSRNLSNQAKVEFFGKLKGYDFNVIIRQTRANVKRGNAVSDENSRNSSRESDGLSNRALLANALESAAQNDIERNRLQQYKAKIEILNQAETRLRELRERIKQLSFARGTKDTAEIKRLQDEATRLANRINTYDKQLLSLESTAPLMSVLKREKEMAVKRAKQKGRAALAAYRDKAAAEKREIATRYQESRAKAVENRNKTAMRHKIFNVVNDLNEYLLHGTKDKHVMVGLQKAVATALDAVNMDTVGADERVAKYDALIAKANDPDVIASLTATRDRILEMGNNMSERLKELKNAYAEIKNSDDPLIANSHDDVIEARIESVVESIGNTSIRNMTLEQLEEVYDMYKMVLTTIRNSNKAFALNKKESIEQLGGRIMTEVYEAGGSKELSLKGADFFKRFGWNALKPVYAFKAIGSQTLSELYDNVRTGEDTWAVDVSEARDFFRATAKKHNYNSWDTKTQHQFVSNTGMTFSLSVEQMMSLYAYSKRAQADDHLMKGGFVFDQAIEVVKKVKGVPVKYTVKTANAYNLSPDTVAQIVGTLTEEQRAFVDEMQTYLSDVMGAKGNEVTLQMYGIKLFKEKNYFPLKSAKQFLFEKNEVAGEIRIKNSGFSKETKAHANNPIILSNFMDVWSNHVNDMSMYHAFVLPLEDFNRAFNFKTSVSAQYGTESVKMNIQNAYGAQPVEYIRQLLVDLNGGARVDNTAGIINKGIAAFKKGAVFASASVVIQQPSSIARAMAYIDAKYFVTKPSALHLKKLWAEVKQYAPVAIIKEMGYFDTNMGMSTTDYIKAQEYEGVTAKMKALVTDGNYRDDILSKAPAVADELVWTQIWEAVKNETAATTDLAEGSEEFLQYCGKRFTEVVVNTQVYDSVLSRSGMMRSKDTGMKMATAFMAEPTTNINMIADAILQGKRGNTKYARNAIGSVAASIILNAILVSLVYAGRDDDEDKTYAEKYVGTLVGELIDSFNPLTMIPFVKDIVSIVQGYEVERSDMAVISDLWNGIQGLTSDKKSTYRKVEDFAGSIATLFGLPVKNIMRDVRGMYNVFASATSSNKTTGIGMGNAIKESITGKADSNDKQLYDAIVSGDKAHADRVKARYKDDKAYESALKKGLREYDPRIKEAAEARNSGNISEYTRIAREIIGEGNFSQDIVVAAINAEINAMNKPAEETTEDDTDKVTSLYKGSDINAALESGDTETALGIIDDLIQTKVENGMDEKSAKSSVKSSITSYWKPLYKAAYKAGDTEEMKRIRYLLKDTGLYGRASEILDTCKGWLKEK